MTYKEARVYLDEDVEIRKCTWLRYDSRSACMSLDDPQDDLTVHTYCRNEWQGLCACVHFDDIK